MESTVHHEEGAEWQLKLFRRSLPKREKLQRIRNLLGSTNGMVCLDVGGDTGVIPFYLRKGGGGWTSAVRSEGAVISMTQLLGEGNVHRIEDVELPLEDDSLDVVVIIDYLEHVEQDDLFVQECHRVLKQSGVLIADVLHHKTFSLVRILRKMLGLVDGVQGRARPGYTSHALYDLLKDGFDITDSQTYSRFFAQCADAGLQFITSLLGAGADTDPHPAVSEEEDFSRLQRACSIHGIFFPFAWIAGKLDYLLFFTRGHRLVVRAKSRPWKPRRGVKIADGRSIAEASLNTKIGTAAPF